VCSARLHEHKVSVGIPLRADANHTGPVENEEASFRTKLCEHIKECCASSSRNTVRAHQGIRKPFTSKLTSLKSICLRSCEEEHALADYYSHIAEVLDG
jgi:hypothetical protein